MKKRVHNSASEKEDMIKIITKNQCSTPADSMNRLNRLNRMPTGQTGCKKSWKFDRMFLEEWGNHEKKWYAIPSSEKGDMIKIITKNQCSTPANSMNRLNRLNRIPTGRTEFQPVEPVAKNLENLIECFWKSKESMKKMVCNSEFEWESYDQNKPECSEPQHAPINSN